MSINLHLPVKAEILRPTITVVGVGGAGGNAVNNMIASSLEGVNFVVANTDAQALDNALTERTIQLGAGITKGLGAGASPDMGRAAAEESAEEIAAHIEGSNMVFITAGMGGGTGTGAAPVVARLAKEQGILTVGVVTKPFQFEGSHRMKLAESGLRELQQYVDTLIIIPNQNLFRIANERTTFADAFKLADEVLHSGVRGVTDLMVKPGLINLDFADIRAVMREMGKAMMGTGEATGDRRAVEAAEAAISNPLLDDVSLKGARALLINITGGMDMTLFEVDEAANRIREEVDPEANIIFGATFSDAMDGRMRVSVVATGIDMQAQHLPQPQVSVRPVAMPQAEQKKPFSFANVNVQRAESSKSPAVKPAFDAQRQPASAPAAPSAADIPSQQPAFGKQMPEARSALSAAEVKTQEIPMGHAQTSLGSLSVPGSSDVAPRRDANRPVAGNLFDDEAPLMPRREPQFSFGAASHAEASSEAEVPEASAASAPSSVVASRAESKKAEEKQEWREPPAQESFARHIFQRMADVGRVLSSSGRAAETTATAARSEPEGRPVQVVEKPRVELAEKPERPAEDEQYLDIPAFLRRQAN